MSGNPKRLVTLPYFVGTRMWDFITITITMDMHRRSLLAAECAVHGKLSLNSIRTLARLRALPESDCPCIRTVGAYFVEDAEVTLREGDDMPIPEYLRKHPPEVVTHANLARRRLRMAAYVYRRLRAPPMPSTEFDMFRLVAPIALYLRGLLAVGRRVFYVHALRSGRLRGKVYNTRERTYQDGALLLKSDGTVWLQLRASRRKWGKLKGESGIRGWGEHASEGTTCKTKTRSRLPARTARSCRHLWRPGTTWCRRSLTSPARFSAACTSRPPQCLLQPSQSGW